MGARACREPAHEHSGGVACSSSGSRWVASFRSGWPGSARRRLQALRRPHQAGYRHPPWWRSAWPSRRTPRPCARSTTSRSRPPRARSISFLAPWPSRRTGWPSDPAPSRRSSPSSTATVVGFASLSPYKERAAYRTTVEDSVYVVPRPRPPRHRYGAPRAPHRDRRGIGVPHGDRPHRGVQRVVAGPAHPMRLRARRHRAPGRPQVQPLARRRRAPTDALIRSATAVASTCR